MNLIKKINYDIEGVYDIVYLCNGQEISYEDYVRIANGLDVEEDMDFEDDYEHELAEYNYDEPIECQCIDCILERYVERIQEVAFGCPHCIRQILLDLVKEIDC